eukprot:PhF_6_TR27966/c0_g1_i3/m.41330
MHYACFLLLTVFALSSISTQQIVNITSMHHLCSLWNTSTANNTTNTATYYVVRNPGVWWNNTFMDDTDDTFCPIPIHHNITVLCEEDDAPLQCPPGSPCFTFVVQPMQNSPSRYNNTINVVGCKFVGSALIAEAVSGEQMERGVDVNLVNVDVDMNWEENIGIQVSYLGRINMSNVNLQNSIARGVFANNVSNFTMTSSTVQNCVVKGTSGSLLKVYAQENIYLKNISLTNGSVMGPMATAGSKQVGGCALLRALGKTTLHNVFIENGRTELNMGGGCLGIFSRKTDIVNVRVRNCLSVVGNAGCMLVNSDETYIRDLDVSNCRAFSLGGGLFLDVSSQCDYNIMNLQITNATSRLLDPCFSVLARLTGDRDGLDPFFLKIKLDNVSFTTCQLEKSKNMEQPVFIRKGQIKAFVTSSIRLNETTLQNISRTHTQSVSKDTSMRMITHTQPHPTHNANISNHMTATTTIEEIKGGPFIVVQIVATVSPRSGSTLQSVVALSQSKCGSRGLNKLSGQGGWMLSPLHRVVTQMDDSMSQEPWMAVLWNLVLFGGYSFVHVLVVGVVGLVQKSFSNVTAKAMFPNVPLSLSLTIMQGTVFFAVNHAFTDTSNAPVEGVIVTLGVLVVVIIPVGYSVWWMYTTGRTWCGYNTVPSTKKATLGRWGGLLLPHGAWSDHDIVRSHGVLFEDYRPPHHKYSHCVYVVYIVYVGCLTGVAPSTSSGCTTVLVLLGLGVLCMSVYDGVQIPNRFRYLSYLRSGTQICYAIIIFAGLHSSPNDFDSTDSTVAVIVYIIIALSLLDILSTFGFRFYEAVDSQSVVVGGEIGFSPQSVPEHEVHLEEITDTNE